MVNSFHTHFIFQSSRICDSYGLGTDRKPRSGTFLHNFRSEYVKRNQNSCSCLSKRQQKASNFSHIQKAKSSRKETCSALCVLMYTLHILLAVMETLRRRLIRVKKFFCFYFFCFLIVFCMIMQKNMHWNFRIYYCCSLLLLTFNISNSSPSEQSSCVAVRMKN
jgi:hypothetical protein